MRRILRANNDEGDSAENYGGLAGDGISGDTAGQYWLVFAIGAFGYAAIEVAFRGYTHWTMAVTGSVCFFFIYMINQRLDRVNLLLRAAVCAGIITAAEFFVGCIVNLVFRWNVWDYSSLRFNLLGQVCPLYTVLWFFVCIPAAYLCKFIRMNIFGFNG